MVSDPDLVVVFFIQIARLFGVLERQLDYNFLACHGLARVVPVSNGILDPDARSRGYLPLK